MTQTEGAASLEGLEETEKATHAQEQRGGHYGWSKDGLKNIKQEARGESGQRANHPEGSKGQRRIFSHEMTCILETSLLSVVAVREINF